MHLHCNIAKCDSLRYDGVVRSSYGGVVVKNHVIVNGKLLQTNKKFSQLKNSQKEKIANWLCESYAKHSAAGKSPQEVNELVIEEVSAKIEEADIWLPKSELIKYFNSKKSRMR